MSLACEPETQGLAIDGPMPSIPESVAEKLQSDPAGMLKLLSAKLEAIAFRLASCRSESEFQALRDEVFEKYTRLCVAASSILKAELDAEHVKDITREAFAEYEAEFSSSMPQGIDRNAADEIIFSVSTLRRAYGLLDRIYRATPRIEDRTKDRELSAFFAYWALHSQLHLDCLRTAIARKIPLAPEVLPAVLSGLRASVMAYSCVKQGVQLRESEPRLNLPLDKWDEEDQLLAQESTDERESTLSGW